MFKYYFEQVNGVAIWPIISLSIFFIFFIGLLWWTYKVLDKRYIDEMSNLPISKTPKLESDEK